MKWAKDLWHGPGNDALDLGRVLATVAMVLLAIGMGWDIWMGIPIELGPMGLGGGIGITMAGAAILIFVKDKVLTLLKDLKDLT